LVDAGELSLEVSMMGATHEPYPPEFRRQMVELVRAGRGPEELARELEPSAQAIRNWMKQAERDAGRRRDGLSATGQEELRRLRREVRQLRLERDILAKAAAWFAREAGSIPSGSSSS
jgi:transposase